jgi:hypothetical protein
MISGLNVVMEPNCIYGTGCRILFHRLGLLCIYCMEWLNIRDVTGGLQKNYAGPE